MMKSKVISVGMAAAFALAGCGGGGSGGSSGMFHSSSSEGGETDTTKIISAECLNEDNLEAGRAIRLHAFYRTTADDENLSIGYFLVQDEAYENNSTDETAKALYYDILAADSEAIDRQFTFMLPTDLAGGNYRILVSNLTDSQSDLNLSVAYLLEKASRAWTVTTPLYIAANDGKPDIEIVSATIFSEGGGSRSDLSDTNDSEAVLTFEVGVVGDSVILNSHGISFPANIRVDNFIADAHNAELSLCIDFRGECKPIEIYSVDENNQTHYDKSTLIETVAVNERKDILVDAVIRGDLFDAIASAVIKNPDLKPEIRFTVGGIEESSTQDPDRNHAAVRVKFAPVTLDLSAIDNTHDRIAPALSNYRYTLGDYLKDIESIGSTGNGGSSGGLDLFHTDLDLIDDPVDDIYLTPPSFVGFDDGIIKVEPETISPDFELVKQTTLPKLKEEEDPIDKISVNTDKLSQLSMTGINANMLPGNPEDLANESVNEKVFRKEYSLQTYGNDYLGLKGTVSGEARFDRYGAMFLADMDVQAYIKNDWYQIAGAEATMGFMPGDFKHCGFSFTFFIENEAVFTEDYNVADQRHMTNSLEEDYQRRVKENLQKLSGIDDGLLYVKGDTWYRNAHEESGNTTVGGIPVTYTIGADGTFGLRDELKLESITRISANLVPYATFTVYGHGGVGVDFHGFGASAGVEGSLNLVDEQLVCSGGAGLKYVDDDQSVLSFIGELHELITNTYVPPSGRIGLYAKATGLGKATYTLWSMESDPIYEVLLFKHQTLFRVDLQ